MDQTEEPHKSHQQHPEENEHHENGASKMFRKVKAKAKKIKNSLANKPDESYEHDLDAEEDDDLEPSPEDVTRTFAPGEDDRYLGGQRKGNIETSKPLEEDPAPPGGGSDYLSGVPNYQSEVVDPTKQGSGEAVVPEIAESLGRMKVTDESSDQRSQQELAKEVDHLLHNKWIPCVEFALEEKKEADGSNGRYWTKWKLPLFRCADSDQVLKEVQECKKEYPNAFIRIIGFDNNRQVECISFIAYKPDERDSSTRRQEFGMKDESGRDLPTGTHDQFSPELSRPKEIGDSGDRRDEATKEKKPSTYTEQFVSATSAITNNAIAAKNALASKLGYSGESGGNKNESSSVVEDETPRSATGYGQKVAGTVPPEKLTPVYEKVKETGSTVMKKLPLSGGVLGVVEEKERGEEKSGSSSARHYLSEKMRPGEEDKALSEMITEKLHLGGGEKKTTKSNEVEVTVEKIPTEQIVEEKANTEVVTGEQGNGGGGMVGRVKGTISSWLGGTREGVKPKSPHSVEESPQSLGTTVGTKGFPDSGARGD